MKRTKQHVRTMHRVGINTRRVRNVKIRVHHVPAERGNFYAFYGNNAVDLDPLPVIRARLTVLEPSLFECDVFEMTAPIQSPAKCEVRSVIGFLNAKCERPAGNSQTNCRCLW
jgi:hypothetical protein